MPDSSRLSICIDIGKVTATAQVRQAGVIVGIQSDGGGGGGGGGLTVQTADTLYVNVSGDTMTGPLRLGSWPVAQQDAASKGYVDSIVGTGGGPEEVAISASMPLSEEIWIDLTDPVTLKYRNPSDGVYKSLPVGVVLPSRQTATITTTSVASNATYTGLVRLEKGYKLYRIATNKSCRTRLYTTPEKRTADLNRSMATDPVGDHGLMLEFVSATGLLSADLSPLVDGFDGKSPPDGNIPYALTNLEATSTTLSVTFTFMKSEA